MALTHRCPIVSQLTQLYLCRTCRTVWGTFDMSLRGARRPRALPRTNDLTSDALASTRCSETTDTNSRARFRMHT